MSSLQTNRTTIVNGLADHANRAKGSELNSTAPPAMPVQSTSILTTTGQAPSGRCECCGMEPQHEGQQGANVVGEKDWYGLEEGRKLYAERAKLEKEIDQYVTELRPEIQQKLKDGLLKRSEIISADLKRRFARNEEYLRRFEKRKETLEFAKSNKCSILPEPPCDVYRVISPERTKKLEAEWDAGRADYQSNNELPVDIKLSHRVPLSAGGCPTSPNNLVAHNRLSQVCLEADEKLAQAQADATSRWRQGGF